MRCGRRAYVHVGTPKTGTTSVQVFLGANAARLAGAGCYLPVTGRLEAGVAAQHNVAWELTGSSRFDPSRGTFDELLAELAETSAPDVCLSSEEFMLLFNRPRALKRLVVGLRAAGYTPTIVVYLRPQADYYESLYVEVLKHGYPLDFSFGLAHARAWLDYLPILNAFADQVGREQVIVRPFRRNAPSTDLLDEFVRIVAPRCRDVATDASPAMNRLNERLPFDEVYRLAATLLHREAALPGNPASKGLFEPLSLVQILGIVRSYTWSNARVAQRYGVRVRCVSPERFMRAFRALLGRDPVSAGHRRWFAPLDIGCGRALVEWGEDVECRCGLCAGSDRGVRTAS